MKTIKRLIFCLMAMFSVTTLSAQSLYDFTVKDDAGNDVSLSAYKGKVLLIVNTATRCGFTPQYKEMESLYEKYASSVLYGQVQCPVPAIRQDRGQRSQRAPALHIPEGTEGLQRLRHQRPARQVHGRDAPQARCRLRPEVRHQMEFHEVPHLSRRPSPEALRANRQNGRSGIRPPRIKQIAHQSTIISGLIIGYSSSIGAFLSSAAMPICSGCIDISFACGREASLTIGVYASMMWRQSLTVIPP